ncbi:MULTISPECIES: hypothetical protein [unclassified Psychrobacter]|jgi:hypothetical protein|uniref:hypothetical protein n=1 Tax=unclassified Psychrobacter TaxID=196806 RepID=UPI000288D2D0|nr:MULTISPECIES: hypothetical protein [unclassified Psychrobacter]MBP3946492.1 hypothetical protein [Psychrobacter sp. K31L]
MATKQYAYKNWLTVGLVAGALALSACGKKDESPMETEPAVDAQTAVEESATASSSDDIAIASADDGMAVGANDDVAVATADDAEVLDGTESSEHVSTY